MDADKLKKQIERSHKLLFEQDRLKTFEENWTNLKGFKYCTPEILAEAGFYNFSSNDCPDNVKCFACGKELCNWEKDDDPWQEHVKRGKKCPFVLYRSKKKTTVQDFLELVFGTKKNMLINHFDQQKKVLQEKEKFLLKKLGTLQKSKK